MTERLTLTVAEAAEILGCHQSTLYRMIKQGTFECPASVKKMGAKKVIARPLLEKWLAGEVDGNGVPVAS